MSTRNMLVPYSNTYEKKYGKLHFIAAASAENLNLVTNTGANLPDSRLLSVWVNGKPTGQLYNSISFSAGDDVQIRMIPWQGDESEVTHFGSGRFFPVFSFQDKPYVYDFYEFPDMRTSLNVRVSNIGLSFFNANLHSISGYAFNKLTNVTIASNTGGPYFSGLFANCSGLISVPETLFYPLTQAQYFGNTSSGFQGGTFYECKTLSNIPKNLFSKNRAVINFYQLFKGCSSIRAIPEGLFDNNPSVTNFASTFIGCSSITSIPEGLFDNNPSVTTFSETFYGCSSITSIPNGLFDNNPSVTTFGATFRGCSSITSIPDGLFDNNPSVTNFNYTFYDCSSITSIPEGLFDNNPSVTTFQYTFNSCSAITSIPERLFINTTVVTTFQQIFQSCSALNDFELYIGSEVVSNASLFCTKKAGTTRIVHVKAGTLTEQTFQSVADACGLTIISDM